METLLGALRIHVERGVNLAIRDLKSSDPYVIFKLGKQKLKTKVVKKNINPEWNDDLTLSISDPHIPIHLGFDLCRGPKNALLIETKPTSVISTLGGISLRLPFVYDRDIFSFDDPMGDAEFDIGPFLEAIIKMQLEGLPNDTIITRLQPNRQNCLAEESKIVFKDGKVVQHMVLRLRNVECGEVELHLHWIDIPGCRGL